MNLRLNPMQVMHPMQVFLHSKYKILKKNDYTNTIYLDYGDYPVDLPSTTNTDS